MATDGPMKASAAIHGWLGPIDRDRRVFYNIPPKDIIKVTPHSKYSNGWAEKEQKGSQRHALPTAWRSVSGEEKGSRVPAVGSEVFVHWRQNEARMHFDGVVVEVAEDMQAATIRYNDGDEEEGLPAQRMLVRVY